MCSSRQSRKYPLEIEFPEEEEEERKSRIKMLSKDMCK